jgi:hypothetical protein
MKMNKFIVEVLAHLNAETDTYYNVSRDAEKIIFFSWESCNGKRLSAADDQRLEFNLYITERVEYRDGSFHAEMDVTISDKMENFVTGMNYNGNIESFKDFKEALDHFWNNEDPWE